MLPLSGLDDELAALGEEVARLQADSARLLRLLELSPREARPPGPVQTGIFDAQPGPVHTGSPAAAKVAFFATLFGARRDVYALRWENGRSGRSGWTPAVRGGWRTGRAGRAAAVPAADRGGDHRAPVRGPGAGPLSAAGRRPLLLADRCCWLAAD